MAERRGEESLPHSIEAEQQLLGALLVDNEVMSRIDGIVTADQFFEPVHAALFEAIRQRIESGSLASPVTLKASLDSHEGLGLLGGPRYLVRMASAAISRSAAPEYAKLVAELAARRELLALVVEAADAIGTGADAATVSLRLEDGAGAVSGRASVKPLVKSHLRAMTEGLEQAIQAFNGDKPIGVSTGIASLDKMISYLRPGNMVTLAARPSMGKTTVAQNIAFSAAMAGVGVFFASLEMDAGELSQRFLSLGLAQRGVDIPYNRILRGELTDDEMREVVGEAKRQESLPIYFAEREVREMSRLQSSARRARQHFDAGSIPLGLAVIDHMGLVDVKGVQRAYDRAGEVSARIKGMAMSLGIPVLALSQLNREVERRDPPIPQLSDLRDSGRIEEDSDVTIFAYRDEYYLQRRLDAADNGADIEERADIEAALYRVKGKLDLIVAKQRSGPTGTVRLRSNIATCRVWENYQEEAF